MGTKGYISPIAIHPGETIKETLDFLDISQKDLSIMANLSERIISEIINGKSPVTQETALKLERVLGISKEGIINMQASYDADVLRLKEEKRLKSEIKHLEKFSCYNELAKIGFVEKTINKIEKIENLLRFFSVNSLSSIKKTIPIAFRKSNTDKINHESLASWLRIGRIEAQKRQVKPLSKEKLKNCLNDMRKLTTKKPEEYTKKLVSLCAECGIVLVYTPYLKKTYVNGATSWLTHEKALIQLSLRYSYADIFWFTFFHEIGHILKHSKKEAFINFEKEGKASQMEKKADDFAQKVLIPSTKKYEKFLSELTPLNIERKLKTFAKDINIDEGIVAGRVGKETGGWRHVARFRKRLKFNESS